MKKLTTLTLLFCLSLYNVFAVTVPPGTNNIQAAINSASPGATIYLQAGTYYVSQTITLNKTLTIQGVGMNTIIQKTNAATADVAAFVIPDGINGCTLRDFRLRGQDRGGPGIMVFSNNNRLINVNVSDCGNNSANGPGSWRAGILLDGAVSTELTNVKSHHNSWVGISQNNSPETRITGADCFLNHGEGLTIDLGSDNCIVRNSLFNENNVSQRGVGGIGIDDVNGADIQHCTINGTKTLHGITFQNNVGGEDGCIIMHNTIRNSAGDGVRVRNCQYQVTHTTIDQNTFSGNGGANEVWECPKHPTSNRMANTGEELQESDDLSINVYPNPASDHLAVYYSSPIDQQLTVKVLNSLGQVLQVTSHEVATGDSEIPVDLKNLKEGIHFLMISGSKYQQVQRFRVTR